MNNKRRILVIDDNEAIHADFRKTLVGPSVSNDLSADEAKLFGDTAAAPAVARPVIELDCASQGQEGLKRVETAVSSGRPYQLAFVDMRMPPGWDGVQTIERLWDVDPDLQVVICTAFSDYSWEQIIHRLGSSDRLLILKKPFDDVEVCQLAAAMTEKWLVTRAARLKQSELEEIVEKRTCELRSAALHDHLTGLPNRQLFNDRLEQAILRNQRDPSKRFAVLFIDFDRFKVINDSLGHPAGDQMLVAVGQRLAVALRRTDTVAPHPATAARLGGDEFIVLLEEIGDDTDAARVADRLLKVLSEPYDLNGHRVQSTASIGVTTSSVRYKSADDVIRDADTAMYRAKSAGKARYVIFDQRMHEEAMTRLSLENDLRRALSQKELFLCYQPIMRTRTGTIAGFEALVRWQHPEKGLVGPLDFVPLAEELGIINAIGAWVMEEAASQLARWLRLEPLADLFMSVNVSRKQLSDAGVVGRIAEVVQRAGIPAKQLKLEITESAVMDNMDHALDVLRRISELGVELHMDDFGTGYSSLSCLHRFPLTGLKIDRAFISTINERSDYATVVDAIVSLAHNLRIHLVAEGVETSEQLETLKTLGCDFAQGYHFARPLDVKAAEEFALQNAASPSPA